MHRAWFTVLLLLAAPLSFLCALRFGSLDTDWATVWQVLHGGGPELASSAILELRLPRAIAAFAVGGMLALSGALLQVLLRNPLADPYVLGISGGAASTALLAMLAGLGGAWISAGALGGAFLSMFLVFGLSRVGGAWTQNRLLLTGVVVAAGWGALISLLLAAGRPLDDIGNIFEGQGNNSGGAVNKKLVLPFENEIGDSHERFFALLDALDKIHRALQSFFDKSPLV